MTAEKKKYGLYVVLPEDISENERHYLITPDYCLLYTSNEPPERRAEVTDLALLPALAKEWLNEQIEMIRREYAISHQRQIFRQAKTFYTAFKRELEAEKRLLAKEGEADGAEETK